MYRSILFLSLAGLALMFFIGGPDNYSPRSFKHAWDFGHIIYFAFFPLLIFSFIKDRKFSPKFQIIIIICVTLFFGTLVELAQSLFDRTPNLEDIFRNLIGASLAIVFLLPLRMSIPRPIRLCLQTILVLVVALHGYPIIISVVDERQARKHFPILSDFQTPFQIHRWSSDAVLDVEQYKDAPGNRMLRIDLTTQPYSGASLKYFPGAWESYQAFQFRIFNPSSETIMLTCRIHDKQHTLGIQHFHDRFNKRYDITHGWNTITIPMETIQQAPMARQMDLRQIHGIAFFASKLSHPKAIYIDDVKIF